MTFELVDLEQPGEKAVYDFTRSAGGPSLAFRARNDVSALVTKVELTYAVAAKLAHREPTMEGTVVIWSKVVAICAAIRRPRSFELCIARIQRKLPWIGSSISETPPSGGAPYMNDFASANR